MRVFGQVRDGAIGNPRVRREMQDYRSPSFRTRLVPDFWPRADQARAKFEDFMGNPKSHTFSGPHQCWDFWYMPNVYCYLRTDPAKVLGRELVDDFLQRLRDFCATELQDMTALHPWMSLHLNGMRHEVHNDSCNGTYAYVFSLTRDVDRFTGGETCVARSGVFEELEPRRNNAWHGFFEVFPARFNQLVLFDDRLPHMVPVVQGTMNPLAGRLCLTGHLR
ncbi:hypothetical protein [Roseiarcus fermentans]|nr:hypothetical protein [Roseiarcus fermentans]